MQLGWMIAVLVAAFALSACNKSSPPPQQPVKPRVAVEIVLPAP